MTQGAISKPYKQISPLPMKILRSPGLHSSEQGLAYLDKKKSPTSWDCSQGATGSSHRENRCTEPVGGPSNNCRRPGASLFVKELRASPVFRVRGQRVYPRSFWFRLESPVEFWRRPFQSVFDAPGLSAFRLRIFDHRRPRASPGCWPTHLSLLPSPLQARRARLWPGCPARRSIGWSDKAVTACSVLRRTLSAASVSSSIPMFSAILGRSLSACRSAFSAELLSRVSPRVEWGVFDRIVSHHVHVIWRLTHEFKALWLQVHSGASLILSCTSASPWVSKACCKAWSTPRIRE